MARIQRSILLVVCAGVLASFAVAVGILQWNRTPPSFVKETPKIWTPDLLPTELQQPFWLLPRAKRDRISTINRQLLQDGFKSFGSERDFFQLELEVGSSEFYMDSVRVAAREFGMFPWVNDTAALLHLEPDRAVDFAFGFWEYFDIDSRRRSVAGTRDTRGFEKARDDWHADVKHMLAGGIVSEESLRAWATVMPEFADFFSSSIRQQSLKGQ